MGGGKLLLENGLMHTQLMKFDKHSNYWDISFDITLTDEELSKCDMDVRK